MKKITVEELLAQNPNVDAEALDEIQRLAERLKDAGLEGARYRLATPQTGRYHRAHRAAATRDGGQPHAHMIRRH